MLTPSESHGFGVSVFGAVLIAAVFAFLFGAPTPLVAMMLVLGFFTALDGTHFPIGRQGTG
jgi:hypothetical protein